MSPLRRDGDGNGNGNGMHLGIFMPNCSNSYSISTYKRVPDDWTFEANLEITRAAEAAGFDFLFPVSRWRGFGGESNYLGDSLETMTWASALLANTRRIGVFSTVHVPVFHPLVVAKMGATLDHIGRGRWGINIVSGWCKGEFEMMGLDILDHDQRYRRTEQFIECVTGLWREKPGSFDYDSEWYQIRGGYVSPQPAARPPIVNAGTSDAARDLVAKHCDWSFMCPPTLEAAAEIASDVKARAKRRGREVRCVAAVMPLWAEHAKDAEAERQKIVAGADPVAIKNWAGELGIESGSFSDTPLDAYAFGAGALPIVGTRDTVANTLRGLYEVGVDGVLFCFHDFLEDTRRFAREVVPLMKEIGIAREPALAALSRERAA